jgi:dimethylhistidine N-methyltransferase
MRQVTPQTAAARSAQFAGDVQYYLNLDPRQLPSRYLYDSLGSALFEAICQLPWYGITRAETRLLAAHARSIFARLPRLTTIVELGPGSGEKLVTLVDAGRLAVERLDLRLVDISRRALDIAGRTVAAVPKVRVLTYEASYETGLAEALRETAAGTALVAFLGSNIGNFDLPSAEAFLLGVRGRLGTGDGFLVGADLVKPEHDLLRAYDDPLGVTAAFNRNLLIRINRELGGDFDVDAFEHRARWNPAHSRVEMHLVSSRRQRVRVTAAELDFVIDAGESIWTESSYKYTPDRVTAMLEDAGFRGVGQWIDPAEGFALTLVEAI